MNKHSCIHSSKVIDSRALGKTKVGIRRRRECSICNKRFTTREAVVDSILTEDEQVEHKALLLKMVRKFKAKLDKFHELVEDL